MLAEVDSMQGSIVCDLFVTKLKNPLLVLEQVSLYIHFSIVLAK